MKTQTVSMVILLILGGAVGFVTAWYLVGRDRDYPSWLQQHAPYRIRRVIEVGRNDLPTRTYTWESRV